jgi:hypothetical protein
MNYEQRKRLDALLGRKARPVIDYNREFRCLDRRARWIENASCGLRVAGTCEEILGHRYAGAWYVDHSQSDTCEGAVLQMPARHGEPRYFAAVTDPYNADCYIVDMDATDDKEEAARWANDFAERYAEDCREDDARQIVEDAYLDAREAIRDARAQHRAIVAELRAARTSVSPAAWPTLCEAIRERMAALRHSVAAECKRIRAIDENPHILFY